MFQVNWLLADYARIAPGGKVDALGSGWSWITAGAPFAVYGRIDVPWDLRRQQHTLRLDLVDTDGHPFFMPVMVGDKPEPLVVSHPPYDPPAAETFARVKPGCTVDWPFAVNFVSGLPLSAGTRYEWRMLIDGFTENGWTLPFSTLEDPPTAPIDELREAA
jgi:hypothetical protein